MSDATDELCRMLDERGVDYRVSETGYSIAIGPCTTAHANGTDTTLDILLLKVTPVQAVEATLGRGTCEWQLVKSGPRYLVCRCSVCGYEHAESMTDKGATDFDPSFCPSCGAKVVER